MPTRNELPSRRPARAIAAGLTVLSTTLLCACGRPHPLAEWNPDAYAPATATGTWSADWWDTATRGTANAVATMPTRRPVVDLPDQDVSLVGAVDIALHTTPETRVAWADARAAAAMYGVSRSAWYPQLTAWFDAAYERDLFTFGGADNIIKMTEFSTGPGATLTWTLLDFGRREAGDRATRDALLSANLQFNRSIQTVVHAVQVDYFELEAAQGVLQAAEQDLALAISLLNAAEQRLVLGLTTLPDALGVRQAHALAGYQVQLARSDVHNARTDLLVSMGLPPNTDVTFATNIDTPLPETLRVDVQQLAELAMAARPDIAAAIANVRTARARIDAATAELAPQVDLAATAAYQYYDYSLKHFPSGIQPLNGDSWEPTWLVGVTGSWLLFDGEARHNLIRAARAGHEAAVQRLEQLRLDAAGETWDAFFDYRAAVDQHTWAQALMVSAQENLDGVQFAYDVGLRTMPDVLSAQQLLASARSARISSRADVLSASADLVYATGDLRTR